MTHRPVEPQQIIDLLESICPDETLAVQTMPIDETVIDLPAAAIHRCIEALIEQLGIHHLSTITGQDTGQAIELLYHFWHGRGITLRTVLNREAPHIDSVTDLIPGAAFYEREVQEMLGVTFDGHPDLSPLLLPDDWDEGPPLRKSEATDV